MNFRTEIKIVPSTQKISHESKIITIGSCFADNVATRMHLGGLTVEANTLGEMFNPLSIAATLERLACGERFTSEQLHNRGDVWFAYEAHGVFDGCHKEEVLGGLNKAMERGMSALADADVVVVTLGTAWVYEREGRVVANCHKMPSAEFVRRRLSVGEVVEAMVTLANGVLRNKQVILTVSPVRHLADGLEGNAVSKSVLRLAVEQVVERCDNVDYFPAYEIVLDDLRDYRFVGADLVHPSQEAVEYVWERFEERYMDANTVELCHKVEALRRAAAHRPLHPDSEEWTAFKKAMIRKVDALKKELPMCDLSAEMEFFRS